MVFDPLYQAERGTSGAGFLRSMFEAAGRVLSATASIVRSEGTDAVGADTGGCFGVKGDLQKQSPLPARAAERAPKIYAAKPHKTKPPDSIQRFDLKNLAVNVGLHFI